MSKIRLLPEDLASQVAAGEVVERPASVVKELVENSIDAGADQIEICVRRGGASLIQVTDNGCGMNRDDALMCLERNATSKIRTREDLAAILTLGFRGEAIPSIASVSKFRLATREPDALSGTEILINAGKVVSVKDCGDPPGTTIEARSLFYNLPARRKFLRTENTEFSHIEQTVKTQAIAHEKIRFTLVRDDRVAFQLPAANDLRERIGGLAGHELAGKLLEIEPHEYRGVTVRGYIGPPGMGRSDRKQQLSFLNGRPVEASIITRALREGYHTALMKGQYPVTFIFLELDPSAVDVNVHPAKREVRFHDGFAVRDAIQQAVSKTLRERMTRPVSGVGTTGLSTPGPMPRSNAGLPPALVQEEFSPGSADQVSTESPKLFTEVEREKYESAPAFPTSPTGPPAPHSLEQDNHQRADSGIRDAESYRIIGVLGQLYVLLESDEGLVLMDQHGAHERVLFEQLQRRLEEQGLPSQRLLAPIMVELPPRDLDLVTQNLEQLDRFGFSAEPFGGGTLKIDAVPSFLKSNQPEQFFSVILEELRTASGSASSFRLGEDLIATTVCRAAVKANDRLREPELARLLKDLLACEMPYCCPHGRPTLIQMSYGELEKKFGRQV
ncbi:MAG: DNA mismatch repair endonuclease MutL [Verrucomicrobiota bacterium]